MNTEFDYKKFLVENKLTSNSRLLNEIYYNDKLSGIFRIEMMDRGKVFHSMEFDQDEDIRYTNVKDMLEDFVGEVLGESGYDDWTDYIDDPDYYGGTGSWKNFGQFVKEELLKPSNITSKGEILFDTPRASGPIVITRNEERVNPLDLMKAE